MGVALMAGLLTVADPDSLVRVGSYTARRIPTIADAILVAETDSRALGPVAPFYRYVWVADGDTDTLRTMALVINYTSHSPEIVRPALIVSGQVMLARIDLRVYAPLADQLARFLDLWENYRNDPKLSLLLTPDMLATFKPSGDKIPIVKVKRKAQKRVEGPPKWRTETKTVTHAGGPYRYPDDSSRVIDSVEAGTYEVELWFREPTFEVRVVEELVEVKLTDVKDVDLLRLPAPHLPREYAVLSERLRTEAPIVSHDYWLSRHLATIKDEGLFAELYGGLYYDFMLYRRDGDGTDEDRILEDLGVGNIKAGLTAEKLFNRLRSDQRVAMFKSVVTGKLRRTDFFRSPAGQNGSGVVSITHDIFDRSVDVKQHPVMNLLKFNDDGREGIAEQPNGLHRFWLTDGKGKLANEAPPDLVADHTIPPPYTRRLQPAISCLRCHGQGRDDGWKAARNDVAQILSRRNKRADIVADLTDPQATIDDALSRIRGLYKGDPEAKLLPRARDDYAAAVLRATGPWPKSDAQVDVVNLALTKISDVYDARNYQQVTPHKALRELGLVVSEKDAVDVLELVLPPSLGDAILGVVPEDPRVEALLSGVPINRVDWDLIYGFAAGRAARALGEKK